MHIYYLKTIKIIYFSKNWNDAKIELKSIAKSICFHLKRRISILEKGDFFLFRDKLRNDMLICDIFTLL